MRPDPARGIFETLLIVDRAPVELDAHMARLAASLEALFASEPPAGARDLAEERSTGIHLGRLRLTVAPAGAGLTLDAVAREIDPALLFPGWDRGAELRSLALPGGLGAHKWADRSLLPDAGDGAVPLLLDRGEEVLEAGWANVFAVLGGELVTAPADGRILAGVSRAAAIGIAREAGVAVRQRRLDRDQLLGAEEIFLTGSVRGLVPARSLDGTVLPQAGELSRLVGDGLRRRWIPPAAAAGARGRATAPPRGRRVR